MGYKASMIIIKEPALQIKDAELLDRLGFGGFTFQKDAPFHDCMALSDNIVSIGYYNNCLIISEDYKLTGSIEMTKAPELLGEYEKTLSALYPGSEILSIACHSTVNYHLYSLVKDGKKIRYKSIASGYDVVEYGGRIEEEEKIYARSEVIKGERLFKSPYREDGDYEYTEDAMMEEFAFGVAKRHLGVKISGEEEENLMMAFPFKKYTQSKPADTAADIVVTPQRQDPAKGSWVSRLFKRR